ncbi:hypothetical protein KUV80_14220 [Fictibacillus nanhaiensis]|uniref:hypothetical protein n=1 Tax=Fictibacillus nanhaiensis TaxID=742169 RepID=UPI001C96C32B|nr:hypothetical protein [Fictibacillus nanhaiensis]MBY6037824.1 hypothetical protein [Fictibacillus nanhaiensis]
MSIQNSSDIRAIEQKARQQHKEADQARSAVQDVLLQKLVQSERKPNSIRNKKENK